jgi:hypothetical protein
VQLEQQQSGWRAGPHCRPVTAHLRAGFLPGESDYSPLWQTVIVRWKPGVTPQVLTSDNMILDLAKKGQLTATKTAVIVNATVVPKT